MVKKPSITSIIKGPTIAGITDLKKGKEALNVQDVLDSLDDALDGVDDATVEAVSEEINAAANQS